MNGYHAEFEANLAHLNRWQYHEGYGAERARLRQQYGFAIPTDGVIRDLCKYGPFVEVGAGMGYWASLFAQHNVDTTAYDRAPEGSGKDNGLCYPWIRSWYPVREGDAHMARHYPNRTLLMIWPNRDDMALQALVAYTGTTIVYVGEHRWGACAPDSFFDVLEAGWTKVDAMAIPQYDGLNDYVSVWRRGK